MQRRKFMIGVGSLAAGSAAAMGTGAFNFANVERDMNVNVAGDSSAFLALESTSAYASDADGTLSIELNSNAEVGGDDADQGNGINHDSDYSFREVFKITNRGTQSVGVWIEDDDSNDSAQWYAGGSGFSDSLEGSGNACALDPGESITVSLVVLTRNKSAEGLPDSISVVADASAGN